MSHYRKLMFISQAVGKDESILLDIFMERDKVLANENAKYKRIKYAAILTEEAWSIKDLLYG